MLQTTKKGFTLIELLVVITIIGILATGAVSVYTSQIQKARDTTRINDVKALQSGIEQVYQDGGEYPSAQNFASTVTTYVPRLPSDPKHTQSCNNWWSWSVACSYAYVAWNDNNGITLGEYELSTAFENAGNVTNRAADDNGDDDLRFEAGLDVWSNTTTVAGWAVTEWDGACVVGWGAASNAGDLIVINGNPSTGECS